MNSSRLVSLFLNMVDCRDNFDFKTNRGAAVGKMLLPYDGVHAPDLGRALQNAEGLGEGLGLVCRSQCGPVTMATSKTAEVMQGNGRGRWKEKEWWVTFFFLHVGGHTASTIPMNTHQEWAHAETKRSNEISREVRSTWQWLKNRIIGERWHTKLESTGMPVLSFF